MVDQGRKLILVRHSLPEMVAGVPASQWWLSVEGRRRCEKLAERLVAYNLAAVVASEEPKAVETGQTVADALGLSFETAPGLHEHERGVVRDIGGREEFGARVVRFFEHPGELVLGCETADQAHARFTAAVARVLEKHPVGNLALVSHGTVMTLFIARANHFDPSPFWKSLGLPAFAILALPGFDLLQVVRHVLDVPTF
jgi:broad specificity phosphatase PhoE